MTQTRPSSFRWHAYRLVRPLVRPIAWRLRSFFTGPLHEEVRALRRDVEALRHELSAREQAVEPRITAVLEQMLVALALDHETRRALPSAPVSGPVAQQRQERS